MVLAELYRFFALIYLCICEKPDVLYAIYFVPHGIYAALAGSLFGIPVVQELIGTDRPKVAKSKLFQALIKKAARVGVRGSSSIEQLVSLGIPREKLFVPTAVNVLDFSLFKPTTAPKLYDLIYCGRMDQNKQINILIDAVALVHQKLPGIRVALVGDGPERINLENQVSQLNLESDVLFTGNQPSLKVPDLLNQSRVFMMASAFEGLPVAMIEAMSCGLPVVVPDIGDIRDVAVEGFNALLIRGNNADKYADAFVALFTDLALYKTLAEGALQTRDKFLDDYSLDKAKTSWQEIFTCVTRK